MQNIELKYTKYYQMEELIKATGPLEPAFQEALYNLLNEDLLNPKGIITITAIAVEGNALYITFTHTGDKILPVDSCKLKDYIFGYEYHMRRNPTTNYLTLTCWKDPSTLVLEIFPEFPAQLQVKQKINTQ